MKIQRYHQSFLSKYKKQLYLIIIVFFINIGISSLINFHSTNIEFINTIYTISGIMFSIGMGVVCTMNPDSIKNKDSYHRIINNIIEIRNNFLFWFGLVSIFYIALQVISKKQYKFYIFSHFITFDLYFFCIALNILSTIYYVVNFIGIQKLTFDIYNKINKN